MAKNEKLIKAKEVKNDEFYTEEKTISNELGNYRAQLKDAIVYCNCDDPTWSNFWKYFHNNFASLGLKKLISTHYQKNTEPSYALIYEGGNDFIMDDGKILEIKGNWAEVNGQRIFYNAGDFRSDACIDFLKEATIVCTNPPFSLFREYLSQLIQYDKKFIILGNQNASHNKEIFPLFKNNQVWYGASIHMGGVDFRMPDDYEEYSQNVFVKDGHHYINLAGIRWFTNLDVSYRHDGLWHRNGVFDQTQAHCYYEGFEDKYLHYDNFDAIDIPSVTQIPIDYDGMMGVPITILDKFNPDEFIIVGIGSGSMGAEIGVKKNYRGRTDIAYTLSDGTHKCPYSRIIIKNKNPIKKSNDMGY